MPKSLSRRKLLRQGLAAGAVGSAAGLGYLAFGRGGVNSPPVERYRITLPIPRILMPVRSDSSADYYEIVQCAARQEILPGLKTTIWGYEGLFPGPTIKVRRGRKAVVRQINQLEGPTVTHLHGGVVPSAADGFPTDLIVPAGFPEDIPLCSAVPSTTQLSRRGQPVPGNVKTHEYPNEQRAATLWYHDHAMDSTGRNVYMGMSGFYLIEDDEEQALPLPRGSYDIPLMICLRQFGADGSFIYDRRGHLGAQGDVVLVNGAPWPRLVVERRKYRFRLLNAGNASIFVLALSSGKPLIQIATDGGLLSAPLAVPELPLAMGERAEVIVDFAEYSVGTKVVLQNLDNLGSSSEIMLFDIVERTGDDPSATPEHLSAIELLSSSAASVEREFLFTNDFEWTFNIPPVSWNINGKSFDPNRIDAAPHFGAIEIWRLASPHTIFPGRHLHSAHLHLVRFQVLERNGAPPKPHEMGWKDTIHLADGDQVRVIARFDGFRGRYVLHCHNLEHEDHSMMARFDVV